MRSFSGFSITEVLVASVLFSGALLLQFTFLEYHQNQQYNLQTKAKALVVERYLTNLLLEDPCQAMELPKHFLGYDVAISTTPSFVEAQDLTTLSLTKNKRLVSTFSFKTNPCPCQEN